MIGIRTLGGYRCPNCQSYSPEFTIRPNHPTFRLYFKQNHRYRSIISTSFMLTIGYYTVFLGFIQYQQSNPILLPKWNKLLVTFIIMYFIVFLISTVIGLTYLRVDYKKWQQDHPNMLICPACLRSFQLNPNITQQANVIESSI